MRIAIVFSFIVVNMLLPVVVSEAVAQAARIISISGNKSYENTTLTYSDRPFAFVMGRDGVEVILKTKKDGKINGYEALKDVGYTDEEIKQDVGRKFIVFFYDINKEQMKPATWKHTVQFALHGYKQLKPFGQTINRMVDTLKSPDATIKYVRKKLKNTKQLNQAYSGEGADTLNALQYIKLLDRDDFDEVKMLAEGLVNVLKGAKKMDLLFAVRAFLWYGCGCTELYGGKGYTLQTTGTDSLNRKVVKKTLKEYLVPNERMGPSGKMFGGEFDVINIEVKIPTSEGAPGEQGKQDL